MPRGRSSSTQAIGASALTIHSSRSRFAARLNSGVRPHGLAIIPVLAPKPFGSHMKTIEIGLATLLLVFGQVSADDGTSKDIDLVIPKSLESSLRPHIPKTPIVSDLISLTSTLSINHKMNFGRTENVEQQASYQWQPSGLLLMTIRGTSNSSKNFGVTTATSICGLIPLLSEFAGESSASFVGVSSPISMYGFSVNANSKRRSRVTRFATSARNICSPEPGLRFSYQVDREDQYAIKTSGFSSSKVRSVSESADCTAGQPQDASALSPSLKGQYLLVTCSIDDARKPPRTTTYAFLTSTGIYIQTSEKEKYETDSTQYLKATYAL